MRKWTEAHDVCRGGLGPVLHRYVALRRSTGSGPGLRRGKKNNLEFNDGWSYGVNVVDVDMLDFKKMYQTSIAVEPSAP